MQWKITAVFLLGVSCGLLAQTTSPPLTFEVASIKPAAAAGPGPIPTGIQMMPGGGFRANNVSLRTLVGLAYDVRDFQITGGPSWLGSQLYDIQARAERDSGAAASPDVRNMTDEQRKTVQEQMRERLRALLADRFQLVIHHESKEVPVYTLVVAKGGPKFQEAKPGGPNNGRMRMGRGELNGEGVPMDFVAQVLSNQLRRPVINKTGLTGRYDIKLSWTPDGSQGFGPDGFGPPGGPPPGVKEPPPPDPNGPTVFTAVQEQLGLRLESEKGPVDLIAIDRAEKASEN